MMGRKLVYAAIVFLLLVPWPVAYAYDSSPAGGDVRIEAANRDAPAWTAYRNAIGGVRTAVDLFYIDTTNSRSGMNATLYLTNADELRQDYRYMVLKIGLYARAGDEWTVVASGNDAALLPERYLTMKNTDVSFPLSGEAFYKLAIDHGSFYCQSGVATAPRFYVVLQKKQN